MHNTKIDIFENACKSAIALLQDRLADCVDLGSQMKQAHWNVKGPSFIALHDLFDRFTIEICGFTDLIAERIVALGGTAEGTVRVAAKRSTLPEYPLSIADGQDHVDALSTALARFGKAVWAGIDEATHFGDQVTGDIFTEISRAIDKQLWLVEAHAQAKR
jgi:starvation-inducible DNA-binding protein